jgi:hypothetical protein
MTSYISDGSSGALAQKLRLLPAQLSVESEYVQITDQPQGNAGEIPVVNNETIDRSTDLAVEMEVDLVEEEAEKAEEKVQPSWATSSNVSDRISP